MGYKGRLDQYCGSKGELDKELELPENDMPAVAMVKPTKRSNGAPTVRAIEDVTVLEGPNAPSKIEGRTLEYQPRKVGLKMWKFAV